MTNAVGSLLITVISLVGILVGIIITISLIIGIQSFQRLASQNHPLAIVMILAIAVTVLAIAYKLGWAQSWIPAKG